MNTVRIADLSETYDGIVWGFLKIRNELEKGNLERCLNHLSKFCDDIAVCDDSSTDGSLDVIRKYTDKIIVLPDDYAAQFEHKQQLVDYACRFNVDWFVWLDGDETFDVVGEEGGIRKLCAFGEKHGMDAFSFKLYNLWRGITHYRTDGRWGAGWKVCLWRNTGSLRFAKVRGLYKRLHPLGLKDRMTDIKLIHYGYIRDDNIKEKLNRYASLGNADENFWYYEKKKKLKLFNADWFPKSAI